MSYFAFCSMWTFIFLLSTCFCFLWPLMPNSTHLVSVPFCLPVIPLSLCQLPSPVVITSIHYLNCFGTSLVVSCSLSYVDCCLISHVSCRHWMFLVSSFISFPIVACFPHASIIGSSVGLFRSCSLDC